MNKIKIIFEKYFSKKIMLSTLWSRLLFALSYQLGWLRFFWYVRIRNIPIKSYSDIAQGTAGLDYSRNYFSHFSPDARIFWPLFLLCSIPDLKKDSLLVLGPRYETELLLANSLGFDKAGLKGLDTYSYSPMIDVGDMHDLPYQDNSFTNIICGWTLSYSTNPQVAAKEMSRVLKPGGYIVLAVQKVPNDFPDEHIVNGILSGQERIQTLQQFDSLFEGLNRVAGFEPSEIGESSHIMVAYSKPK